MRDSNLTKSSWSQENRKLLSYVRTHPPPRLLPLHCRYLWSIGFSAMEEEEKGGKRIKIQGTLVNN